MTHEYYVEFDEQARNDLRATLTRILQFVEQREILDREKNRDIAAATAARNQMTAIAQALNDARAMGLEILTHAAERIAADPRELARSRGTSGPTGTPPAGVRIVTADGGEPTPAPAAAVVASTGDSNYNVHIHIHLPKA